VADSPNFHHKSCAVRRRLLREERKTAKNVTVVYGKMTTNAAPGSPERAILDRYDVAPKSAMNYRGVETRTIGEATVKVSDDGGYIMAAISFDGLRWMARSG
jgi:hypothetical protein